MAEMNYTEKQDDHIKLAIENGDEKWEFALDYCLAFGIFKKGHESEMVGGDKFLAIGVQSSDREQPADAMDELLLRVLDVMVKSYSHNGINYADMQKRLAENFAISACRNIREEKKVSSDEAVKIYLKEVGQNDHRNHNR